MRIAIVGRLKNYEDEVPFGKRYYISSYFVDIFNELGILFIPVVSEKNLDQIYDICDGLIVTGSINDVHPKYYNDEPLKNKKFLFDEFPLVSNIVKLFAKGNKPILGICAGIQEINVIFGGTLHQKIPNHNLLDQSKHVIKISDNSVLFNIYNKNIIDVNSYHCQAIKDLAPDFKITAISNDGIIEGIEKDNILAVQWHPEILHDTSLFKKFFKI